MQTFDDAGKFGKEFMDSGLKSLAALSRGMQAISLEAADYSKQAFESAGTATERVLASKSLDTAMAAQSDYMKSAYEGFVAQATRMSDLYADLAKDVYQPFENPAARAE